MNITCVTLAHTDLIIDKPKTIDMKKPIREYLSELPAPYNTLALSVVDEKYEGYQAEVNSLYNAILYMCDWRNTPQGWHFWDDVYGWCINPKNKKLPRIQAVEVSPEVEQPKTEMESCLDKKLSDNPTIADSIGSHMHLAFEYSKQLVNENTRLRAQLYRLPILEQENAQLKAELLSNPKELVYDAEWLANVVKNYDDIYLLSGETVSVGGVTLSPKDSAPIIASLGFKVDVDNSTLNEYPHYPCIRCVKV